MRALRSLAAFLLASSAFSAAAQFQPGREFLRLDPPHAVTEKERVEVVEFFYYGCPVCYETQAHLNRWLAEKPPSVALRRVPALSSEKWEPYARLFYSLEALGELDRLHGAVYDGIHFWEIKLDDPKERLRWIAGKGIDRGKFMETFSSDDVAGKVTLARELLKSYGVKGVPTFVVDGKFLTSARLAGGTKEVIGAVKYLVNLAREERKNR